MRLILFKYLVDCLYIRVSILCIEVVCVFSFLVLLFFYYIFSTMTVKLSEDEIKANNSR